MKKKKDENTETTENVKNKKKAPIIIAVIALIVIIGACNANGNKDYSVSDNSTSTSQTDNTSNKSSDKFEITSLKHGELLEYTTIAGPLVIKAKIESSLTNKLTINQNYMNVADIILNQGGNNFDEIQYWAVADMADGSESKVIQFTLDKNTIDGVYNGNIVDIQLGDYVTDLWILPSLKE